jgi:hypothetical protein
MPPDLQFGPALALELLTLGFMVSALTQFFFQADQLEGGPPLRFILALLGNAAIIGAAYCFAGAMRELFAEHNPVLSPDPQVPLAAADPKWDALKRSFRDADAQGE